MHCACGFCWIAASSAERDCEICWSLWSVAVIVLGLCLLARSPITTAPHSLANGCSMVLGPFLCRTANRCCALCMLRHIQGSATRKASLLAKLKMGDPLIVR